MSRAKAASERVALDAYFTPDRLAFAICGRLHASGVIPDSVVEPSAGGGAFVRAAKGEWNWAKVFAVDVDETRRPGLLDAGADDVAVGDWAEVARATQRGPERFLVVGNPPYRQAQDHVEAAFDFMRTGDYLAFLLRINFLGSVARVGFWRQYPLAFMAPIAPRPSFTGGGTDGTEYALFVWQKNARAAGVIQPPLTWSPAADLPVGTRPTPARSGSSVLGDSRAAGSKEG